MQFKIDTKSTYTVITSSQNNMDENMTDALAQKIQECTNKGSVNFVLDMSSCETADNKALDQLYQIHETCYEAQSSFVVTGMSLDILAMAKKADIVDELNIVPTMIEAVDIISMEILERDLLSED